MEKKPGIILSSLDYDRLESLLDSLPDQAFPGKKGLQAELDRAEVVEPRDVPPGVVTMNSTVRFALEDTGEEFSLTLVYPRDADGKSDRISVLAPVGSALLGLSTGEHIEWPGPGGKSIRVRIVEIVFQPERAGEFHR
ncbi:MAG: nucleoside diphosphate kinase regulator [Gammaproteobacteria bacterium]